MNHNGPATYTGLVSDLMAARELVLQSRQMVRTHLALGDQAEANAEARLTAAMARVLRASGDGVWLGEQGL